jgi:tellurite methyltransferase
MSREDRTRWDTRHAKASHADARASVQDIPKCTNNRLALDLACGQGRHSLALAERGYLVVAGDVSEVALAGLGSHPSFDPDRISRVQVDFDTWPFRENAFDLIVQCDFLDRRLIPAMLASVKPGGAILIDTFAKGAQPNASGPSHHDYLLLPGELRQIFTGWKTQIHEDLAPPTCRAVAWAERQ